MTYREKLELINSGRFYSQKNAYLNEKDQSSLENDGYSSSVFNENEFNFFLETLNKPQWTDFLEDVCLEKAPMFLSKGLTGCDQVVSASVYLKDLSPLYHKNIIRAARDLFSKHKNNPKLIPTQEYKVCLNLMRLSKITGFLFASDTLKEIILDNSLPDLVRQQSAITIAMNQDLFSWEGMIQMYELRPHLEFLIYPVILALQDKLPSKGLYIFSKVEEYKYSNDQLISPVFYSLLNWKENNPHEDLPHLLNEYSDWAKSFLTKYVLVKKPFSKIDLIQYNDVSNELTDLVESTFLST